MVAVGSQDGASKLGRKPFVVRSWTRHEWSKTKHFWRCVCVWTYLFIQFQSSPMGTSSFWKPRDLCAVQSYKIRQCKMVDGFPFHLLNEEFSTLKKYRKSHSIDKTTRNRNTIRPLAYGRNGSGCISFLRNKLFPRMTWFLDWISLWNCVSNQNLKKKFDEVVTCGIQAGKSPMINAAKTVFEYTCISNQISFTTAWSK